MSSSTLQNSKYTTAKLKGLCEHLTVLPTDAFSVRFRRPFPKSGATFLAPVLVVDLVARNRTPIRLRFRFAIQDVHLARVTELLGGEARRRSRRNPQISIEFSGSGHSYDDLFSPLLGGEIRRVERSVYSRVGLNVGADDIFGKSLIGKVVVERGPYTVSLAGIFDWYLFACHSIWGLKRKFPYAPETFCTGPCTAPKKCQCLEYGGPGGLKTTCFGFQLCACV